MSKEYKCTPKYDIGDEVWIVEEKNYDNESPGVFYGKVKSLVFRIQEDGEILPDYTLEIAGAYHLDKRNFFEFQLLTEKEAKKIYKVYRDRMKFFTDDYVKTQVAKAKKFVEEYDKS